MKRRIKSINNIIKILIQTLELDLNTLTPIVSFLLVKYMNNLILNCL